MNYWYAPARGKRLQILIRIVTQHRLINIGALSGIATTLLERYVGFWAAFLLPYCGLWLALATLLLSSQRIRRWT
jgi:hypothetical protein